MGNKIDNTQSWNLTSLDWNQLSVESLARYRSVKQLSEACPVYNCHGLTFGSRRTAVTHDVVPILADDGFEQITEQQAREGDIVVYIQDEEISHTGLIIGREPLLVGSASTLRIWSKWAKGPEMSHRQADCPYYDNDESVEFYTLVKWKNAWRAR